MGCSLYEFFLHLSPNDKQEGSAVRTKYLAVLSLTILTAGCTISAERLRGQLIQPDDTELPNVVDNLVLMDVRVTSNEVPLKLYSMQLDNLETGEPWNLALFSNMFLKTKELPFEQQGDAIHHTVAVDLPAGRYRVKSMTLKNYFVNHLSTNVAQTFEHTLGEDLVLQVKGTSQAQYLGQIDFHLRPYGTNTQRDAASQVLAATGESMTSDAGINTGGTGHMPGATASAMATDVQTLYGRVDVSVVAASDEMLATAKRSFAALSDIELVSGALMLEK